MNPTNARGLAAPPGGIVSNPLANSARALMDGTCPPNPITVKAFQAAYAAATPGFVQTGVYDAATVAALYITQGVPATCPPVELVALAQAAVADPSFCSAYDTNASVPLFMAGYSAWKQTVHVLVPPPTFAQVSNAINEVLGPGSAPTCAPAPGPGGGPGGGGAGGSGGGAAATSNTTAIVAGAVALAAVGGLFYMMMQGGARAAASGAAIAKPNPYDERRYKRELLYSIRTGETSATILSLQGHDDDARRIERLVLANVREADARGWGIAARNAYESGQRAGDRAIQRGMAVGF